MCMIVLFWDYSLHSLQGDAGPMKPLEEAGGGRDWSGSTCPIEVGEEAK